MQAVKEKMSGWRGIREESLLSRRDVSDFSCCSNRTSKQRTKMSSLTWTIRRLSEAWLNMQASEGGVQRSRIAVG